jgi:hypothetical protein
MQERRRQRNYAVAPKLTHHSTVMRVAEMVPFTSAP